MTADTPIWARAASVDEINALCAGTMHDVIGLEFTELGPNYLEARIPVDERTRQPFGILHGGAAATLAEALGSVASGLVVDSNCEVLGVELNANHLRAVGSGHVTGRVTAIHLGKTLHVWDIRLRDDAGRPTCVARLTALVRPKRVPPT